MARRKALRKSDIRAAIRELDELCKAEYGIELEQLLIDPAPVAAMRMQRLTGIVLKRKFATPSLPANYSVTGARRAWPWRDGSPERRAVGAERELELLNRLRMPGPWNERKPLSGTRDDESPITWDEFRDDVDNERGLFKVIALYVADQVKGREGKTLRDYLDAKESRRFEAGLDLTVLLSDAVVVAPIASLLGLPTLAVGVALVGIQYGHRTLMDAAEGRRPDSTG